MAALTITASIASAQDTQNQQSSATSTASERTIYQQPILTKGEQIVAAPTLIKSSTTIDNAPPRLDTVPGARSRLVAPKRFARRRVAPKP